MTVVARTGIGDKIVDSIRSRSRPRPSEVQTSGPNSAVVALDTLRPGCAGRTIRTKVALRSSRTLCSLGAVYAIDTSSGNVTKIPVGAEPHGLTVWPQPGRYSLGHTGNMR